MASTPPISELVEPDRYVPANKSHFLSLPAELRNQIYELALQLPECDNPDNCFCLRCEKHQNFPIALPITKTCRQISSETVPMFYAMNTIRVDIRYLRKWIWHMRSIGLNVPDRVRIMLPSLISEDPTYTDSFDTDFEVTPLINILETLDTGYTSARDYCCSPLTSRPSFTAPFQLLEIANDGAAKSPSNSWTIGLKHENLTSSGVFWRIVRNAGWRRWMRIDPPFIKNVTIGMAPTALNDDLLIPIIRTIHYDPTHIIIGDCGSAWIVCSKVIASLRIRGLERDNFTRYEDHAHKAFRYCDHGRLVK